MALKQLYMEKFAFAYKRPLTPVGELSILSHSTLITQNIASQQTFAPEHIYAVIQQNKAKLYYHTSV